MRDGYSCPLPLTLRLILKLKINVKIKFKINVKIKFKTNVKIKFKTNVKSSGQECPLYTFCEVSSRKKR